MKSFLRWRRQRISRPRLSVNLYTTLNEEPEEFEITVNLVNENSRELEAFLYADGSFEKSKNVGKESSAELGTIELKEGIHNLSVRWQDDDTRIEYEKTKKLMVKRDEVVIFYAPKGVSFEAKNISSGADDRSSGDSDKKTSIKDEQIDKEIPSTSRMQAVRMLQRPIVPLLRSMMRRREQKSDVIETKDEASSRYGIDRVPAQITLCRIARGKKLPSKECQLHDRRLIGGRKSIVHLCGIDHADDLSALKALR